MTVLHTGSNNTFSSNWGSIFGKGKKADTKPARRREAGGRQGEAAKADAKKAAVAKKPAGKKKGKK